MAIVMLYGGSMGHPMKAILDTIYFNLFTIKFTTFLWDSVTAPMVCTICLITHVFFLGYLQNSLKAIHLRRLLYPHNL